MKARAARLLVLCCITALTAATAASATGVVQPGLQRDEDRPGRDRDVRPSQRLGGHHGVRERPTDQVFDFQTDGGIIASVVAKGGTDYATWDVNDSAATGLHAPLNPHSGYWYDLSYLCFTPATAASAETPRATGPAFGRGPVA